MILRSILYFWRMKITADKVVSISYTLTDGEGELIDQTTDAEPFHYIQSSGITLDKFDEQLDGLSIGDGFDFTLSPQDGYGIYEEENVVKLPASLFEEAPDELIEVGQTLPMTDEDGNELWGTILEIGETEFKIDFNHPLAGYELHFKGKITNVREATPEELEKGYIEQGIDFSDIEG